jgi:uncharacterized Zn-binding protein involved in type VI secretion
MPAAARLNDNHTCPAHEGPHPHVGGPILGPGCSTVLIEGQPAAHAGDFARCQGSSDTVVQGSRTVMIEGQPAVRVGDKTAHGGIVVEGCRSVLIGSPELETREGLQQRRLELSAQRNQINAELDRLVGPIYRNADKTIHDMVDLSTSALYAIPCEGTLTKILVDTTVDIQGRVRVAKAYQSGDNEAILDEAADRGMDAALGAKTLGLSSEEQGLAGVPYSAGKAATKSTADTAESAHLVLEHDVLIRRVGNVNRQLSYINQRLDSDRETPDSPAPARQ